MKNSLISSGKVLALYLSIKDKTERSSQEKVVVDENGIVGDKFYGKDPQRSILLTSVESYRMAEKEKIIMAYGSLGENILIDYNPYLLDPGSTLSIGDVVLEICQNCTICKSLTKIDSKLPKLLKNDRGVFVKVLKGGTISVDNTIHIGTRS